MKKLTVLIACILLTLTVYCQHTGAEKEAQMQGEASTFESESNMSQGEMMELWMDSKSLGEEHAKLKESEGTYNYVSTFWTHPGAPKMTSKGVTTIEHLMDGRYFIERHEGETMGMPFEGLSIVGYDKTEKVYVSTWIDNMGTGILKFTGQHDETGALVSNSSAVNPITGKMEDHKVITKPTNNGWVMDYYIIASPDDKEFHSMHIVYERID